MVKIMSVDKLNIRKLSINLLSLQIFEGIYVVMIFPRIIPKDTINKSFIFGFSKHSIYEPHKLMMHIKESNSVMIVTPIYLK